MTEAKVKVKTPAQIAAKKRYDDAQAEGTKQAAEGTTALNECNGIELVKQIAPADNVVHCLTNDDMPKFSMIKGIYETYKHGKALDAINYSTIIDMVMDPQQNVSKYNSLMVSPSTHKSRANQDTQGNFGMLWGDIDQHVTESQIKELQNNLPFSTVAYSSKSATVDCQKWRVLAELLHDVSLSPDAYKAFATILNDKLEAAGIVPDRSSEKVAQYFHLPNKGEFYKTSFCIDKPLFNPKTMWEAERENYIAISQTVKGEPKPKPHSIIGKDSNVIDKFCREIQIIDLLPADKYEVKDNRILFKQSDNGKANKSAGVQYATNCDDGIERIYSHHANDPLNDGYAHSSYDIFKMVHGIDSDSDAVRLIVTSYPTFKKENDARVAEYILQHNIAEMVKQKELDAKAAEKLTTDDGDELSEEATAPVYLIDEFLEERSDGVMVGTTGVGKTFCAIDMVKSICTGRDFMGRQVYKTGVVLYINGEGVGGFKRRIRASVRESGAFGGNFKVLHQPLQLNNEKQMAQLKILIAELDPVLVVADTFSSLSGGAKESDNSEVSYILTQFKQTCGDAATMLIHHPTKADATSIRGAGAFENNVEFVYCLEKDPTDTDGVVISCRKQKDGEKFKPFRMKLKSVGLGFNDQKGVECTSLVMIQGEGDPMQPKGILLDKKAKVLLEAIEQAIAAHGVVVSQTVIDMINADTKWLSKPDLIVDVSHVKTTIAEKNPTVPASTNRSTLCEGKRTLLARHLIGELDGFMWINKES